MDITYECLHIYDWLRFMQSLDIVNKAGINPFIIVEFVDYVHAYVYNEAIEEVCHIGAYEKPE